MVLFILLFHMLLWPLSVTVFGIDECLYNSFILRRLLIFSMSDRTVKIPQFPKILDALASDTSCSAPVLHDYWVALIPFCNGLRKMLVISALLFQNN
jgi:hypothetical protein